MKTNDSRVVVSHLKFSMEKYWELENTDGID